MEIRKMREKPIMLEGPFHDLSDILRVARSVGKKLLSCDLVKIDPRLYYLDDYRVIVIVSREKG